MTMPTNKTRLWLIAYFVAVITPVALALIKPPHYSFYMFYPASPETSIGRLRLAAANGLLVVAFLVAAVAAIRLSVVALRRWRWWYLLLPLIVLLHPFFQPVFLEHLDENLNDRWLERVNALNVIGSSEAEVLALIGKPSRRTTIDTYTLWEYKPLPCYWIGSKGQIFFLDGRVTGFEGNDD